MRTRSRLHALLLGLTGCALVACGPASSSPPRPSPSAGPSTAPGASVAPSLPAAPSASAVAGGSIPKAWLLVGRSGESRLALVMAETGEIQEMTVPDGVPAERWSRVVTATSDGASTIVRDDIVQPGNGGPELRLAGAWRLPTVGLDPIPAGRSLDGSTIALVEGAYDPSAARTRFAILQHYLLDAVQTSGDTPLRLARIVELDGAFEYDTLSPDGRILYVIEHLDRAAGGHYQVRAIDVDTGKMRHDVIVDKGNPEERMAGSPIAQVHRADGVVLTLYRGPEHPFIHMLQSNEAWAFCIDLPTGKGGAGDEAGALDWGLTDTTDGSTVYAVNASLGLAVDVDTNGLAIRRTASIGTTASLPIVLAKFGHSDIGPTGRRLVGSPDGTTLFAAGANGVTVIRTKDLGTVRQDLAGSAVEAIGITPNGATLFALTRDGSIIAVDAASGTRLGTVPGSGYARLLAVAPW